MTQWEYKIALIQEKDAQGTMDSWGESGWELVSGIYFPDPRLFDRGYYRCIFKRPKQVL